MPPRSRTSNHFDVLVVGAGSGLDIASYASEKGLKVALLEEGPMGGTCHNRGCIPSKMLIHAADVAETIMGSNRFKIHASYGGVNWERLVRGVFDQLDREAQQVENAVNADANITLFKQRGRFVGEKKLQVSGQSITADKIFIVGGSRPFVPFIPGLEDVPFLTSETAMRLQTQPRKLAIIGGGYVACELAHFFGALGTQVTLLVRGDRLLADEDAEISEWFTQEFSEKYDVRLNTEAQRVTGGNGHIDVQMKQGSIVCDQLLVATGRLPNTDILNVEALGIDLDSDGNIIANEYLETSVPEIYALGDIVGIHPFKHTANHQANYAIWNGIEGRRVAVDYTGIGHAVFSSPQVASVGKTEQELMALGEHYQVGRAEFAETAMGDALNEKGLVKFLLDQDGEILGCHIVGPDASTLIHEAIVAMKAGGGIETLRTAVHIHPALSEVVWRATFQIKHREPA